MATLKTRLLLCAAPILLAALAIGPSSTSAIQSGTVLTEASTCEAPETQRRGTRRYGPLATMRRANEVANQLRNRGYNAWVGKIWGGYYVYYN